MKINLKQERTKKIMSQKMLEKKTGVSQQAISMYERGERNPSVKTAKKIAAVLGISWTEFFED